MATTDLARDRMSGNSHGARDAQAATEKSVAELAGDLARQMTALVHDEIELAKSEMGQKGKRVGLGAGLLGFAGLLGVFAFACFTACAVAAISLVMSVWLGALLVGAGYLLVAGIVALIGRSEIARATPPVPAEAMQSTKEDVAWLKTQMQSARQ